MKYLEWLQSNCHSSIIVILIYGHSGMCHPLMCGCTGYKMCPQTQNQVFGKQIVK